MSTSLDLSKLSLMDALDLAAYIEVDGGSNLVFQGIMIFLIMFVIFNTLLMSVMERRGEIGLRRALGATRRHIALQFVSEALALAVVGGVIRLA